MCFKITSDLFCTNPTTPSSVEAPRPISRYFPRVSEKLVLAAAAEELERAPPRQVPRETFFEILDWKRTSSGIRRYSSSGGKNRSILVLLKKKTISGAPPTDPTVSFGVVGDRYESLSLFPTGTLGNFVEHFSYSYY